MKTLRPADPSAPTNDPGIPISSKVDDRVHRLSDPGELPTVETNASSIPAGKVSWKRPPAARRPLWLSSSELVTAIAETSDDVINVNDLTNEEVRTLARSTLGDQIDYIANAEFDLPTMGRRVFASEIRLQRHDVRAMASALRRRSVELPGHLNRLCEAALLTSDQERMLFQRMNFLRQQAANHRDLLNPKRPSRIRLQLIQQYMALANWHRDRIVEANLRLVVSIVKKFVNSGCGFDELLSDGIVAIMRAVEKFDFDRGFRFSTYATQVIRRSSYQTVIDQQRDRQTTMSGLQDMDLETTDEGRESAISEKRWHELRGRLRVMMDRLDRREKFIICARFSLGAHRKVYTLQSLANRLGVSKERVRQLERRALEKLRVMAGDREVNDWMPQE